MNSMCSDELLWIDGSQGEGGGQIVRSSLGLSLVTGRPIRIDNIRAGRKKPGLMRQHLTAVNAASEVGAARISGAKIGSRALAFEPQAVTPGEYRFSVGTAGSATLVLQTVLPALLVAEGPSKLTLEGGTHNRWAPPFEFLQRAYLPLVNRMGPRVEATLERYGFYPAGGGRISVTIQPSGDLQGFDLVERGEFVRRQVRALVSNLPRHIGDREVNEIIAKMNWDGKVARVDEVDGQGPGNVVFAEIESEHVTEVFVGFGRIGARAEQVAREVVRDLRDYVKTEVPVGSYLADQLLLPLGISAWQSGSDQGERGGTFRTLPLTMHSTTHIEILRQFLGITIDVDAADDNRSVTVRVGP